MQTIRPNCVQFHYLLFNTLVNILYIILRFVRTKPSANNKSTISRFVYIKINQILSVTNWIHVLNILFKYSKRPHMKMNVFPCNLLHCIPDVSTVLNTMRTNFMVSLCLSFFYRYKKLCIDLLTDLITFYLDWSIQLISSPN